MRREALTAVLQDQVSGGQAHPELLQWVFYPLRRQVPPLVPHWLGTTGLIIFPECHLDLLTLPCTSPRSYVLNSPIK